MDESVLLDERIAAVYSHDNESVLSNGHFKAIHSEDDGDITVDYNNVSNEERDDGAYDDRNTIQDVASVESDEYFTSACTNCLIETFHINPKELVVKIMAFSIPARSGLLEPCCEQVPLPGSPGFVCVGRVMTQTPKFCDIQLNDRVLCILPIEKDAQFETFANIPFYSAIKVDKTVDPIVQVSLVLTYLPALQILQSLPFKVKNKKVLLNGGVGPVNRSLIHLCILHGAKKIYVPCQKKHREEVRRIGGKTAGPKHSDWGPSFIGEFDIVIDAIGENGYTTSKAVLNEKGCLCIIGNTHSALQGDGVVNSFNKMILDYRVSNYKRTHVFHLHDVMEKDRLSFIKDFEYLNQLIDDGRIEPMFTRVSLDEYREESDQSNVTMINAPIICDPWSEYSWE